MISKAKILVVDDDAVIRQSLSKALQKQDYDVRTAADGSQGLETAWEWRPDLILLDVILPGMLGTEVCKLLKENLKTRYIPVLLITSLDRPADVAAGLEAGASDYITKPFSEVELKARVATHLRTSRIIGELVGIEKHISLGRLTAGLCHEVNNPLTVVLGQLEMMQTMVAEQRPQKCVRLAFESARRIQALVRAMRDYAEPLLRPREDCDLNAVMASAVSLASLGWAGRAIEVRMELGNAVPQVRGDQEKLKQVFINILTNASQIMTESGTITVRSGVLDGDGAWVFGSVSDTGKGISKANQDRIFDPFWTTKENWQSPGLGLSVARRIIEEHQGRIEVESEEGRGSTFRIILPAFTLSGGDVTATP
ncbi:MAG: response regulator [Candidatus Riflebacteria bacterium]|nr:response regulator [Candidatus Riflebacteria bacterium]